MKFVILLLSFLLFSTNTVQAWPDGSGWLQDVMFLPGNPELPDNCQDKQVFVDTDATSGERFYICENGEWVLQTGGDGSGSGGGGGGTSTDAVDVTYANATYPNVASALDFLLFDELNINTFTNNKNAVEIGSTITSTILNWTLNKAVTSQSLNNSIGSISELLRTYTHTSTYTTDRTYILTADDGTGAKTASTTINFRHKRYWGVSANTSLSDGQIIALNSELTTTKTKSSFTLTPSAQYMYYCYPQSFGTAAFTVNGLANNDFTPATQTHVNASGNSSSYYCYKSNQLLTGTYSIGVQ